MDQKNIQDIVDLPVAQEDWRGLDRARQQARLRAFLEEDRRRGFDLSAAPLMRLAVLCLDEANHGIVWSYHHILLDGWSVVLLSQEVQTCYQAFQKGQPIDLPPPRPFRDYIAWLQKKDWQAETAFWQQKLDGCASLTTSRVSMSRLSPGCCSTCKRCCWASWPTLDGCYSRFLS